jgi:hypothetical protein
VARAGLSVRSATVERMTDLAQLLMTDGIPATCVDCGDERLFVPVADEDVPAGEFCCTTCDAAVFLVPGRDGVGKRYRRRRTTRADPPPRRAGSATAVS